MTLPLYYYVLGTPLGVLGLIRWGCWLIRRVPAVLYRPIVNDNRERISIVVPVYQEDPEIFQTAIESWLRNGVEEVILVIDASDARCQAIAARYPVTVLVTDVPGKRDALRKGWNHAKTPIVALVDSDTIWADDVAAEVSKPFADPRIGGVGTRQSVYGSKGFLGRMTDMFLDHRYFDENASQSLLGKAVSCLSGRTAVYRRSVLMDIEEEFMHETFWGPATSRTCSARRWCGRRSPTRGGSSSSSACAGPATPGARTCGRCRASGCGATRSSPTR